MRRHGLSWLHPSQGVAIIALAVSRAANVWPNAALVNYVRPPDLRIPQAQQFMIWFSGMRGAMAFAMVLRALEDLPGEMACLTFGITSLMRLYCSQMPACQCQVAQGGLQDGTS